MALSTISIRKSTKKILEEVKRTYELEKGKTLTWDEFLVELASKATGKSIVEDHSSVLELSDEEAEKILELVEEGRKSWLKRASTPMY